MLQKSYVLSVHMSPKSRINSYMSGATRALVLVQSRQVARKV